MKRTMALAGSAILGVGSYLSMIPSAAASAGCTADNFDFDASVAVDYHFPGTAPTASVEQSAVSCTYISAGPRIHYTCDLTAGACRIMVSTSTTTSGCAAPTGTVCTGTIAVPAGTVVTAYVAVGSVTVTDTV